MQTYKQSKETKEKVALVYPDNSRSRFFKSSSEAVINRAIEVNPDCRVMNRSTWETLNGPINKPRRAEAYHIDISFEEKTPEMKRRQER